MSTGPTRRDFLRQSAAAAWFVGFQATRPAWAESNSPNEKLNIAIIGCGNKGGHNLDQLVHENIIALCDVDSNYLDKQAERFPQATKHKDYRVMLGLEAGNIDAVVVSTADHTHAPATAMALSLSKHVYCEKPLTHTVREARHIARLATKYKVATQMGTQVHAESNYRRVVEVIRSGAIGPVREVYNWCNKGWSDGRFGAPQPVPSNLSWNDWLGPAKLRSYCDNIHPANWRRFWEYGSGTFGDMAAHVMDLSFWALDLRYPTSVQCEGPPVHPDGAPAWVKAVYEFPARGELPPVKFHWSDGGAHHDLVKTTKDKDGKSLSEWGLGILFVGDKGMLVADYGRYQLFPADKFADYQPPEKSIPDSIGHWKEWTTSCKTGSPTLCNFDYAGALTETILLGIVAYRTGEKLDWDALTLQATNSQKAENYLTKEYRKGWEVAGLK